MLNKITIVTGLMTVIALSQGSIARADDVTDAINEANGVASQAEWYHENVLTPQIEQQERYLNQLQSLCIQGNTQACRESTDFYRRQSDRYDRVIEWQRQRLGN
jgi:flagellar basal body P-ring protein FlgI